MATTAVPGANKKNFDTLHVGCWAEDAKKESLVFVAGLENGQVVYLMYDLTSGMFYQDAMLEKDFKTLFSYPPVGKSKEKWTWHDKTDFPWSLVMPRVTRPVPQHSDVQDTLSAAKKIADDLNLRAQKLTQADIAAQQGQESRPSAQGIMQRISRAIDAFLE